MSKLERIRYAKENVPRGTIISLQNAFAMAISSKNEPGLTTLAVRGFAGKRKANVGIVIQTIPNSNNHYISVIKDDGKHISSYVVKPKKLSKIMDDDFWVWKDHNYN